MSRTAARKPKNANRRLGDRLWSAAGQEYGRVIGASYYLKSDELSSLVEKDAPAVGLLRDHAAVEWFSAEGGTKLLLSASANGAFDVDERRFRATLWKGPAAQLLVLLEEDH